MSDDPSAGAASELIARLREDAERTLRVKAQEAARGHDWVVDSVVMSCTRFLQIADAIDTLTRERDNLRAAQHDEYALARIHDAYNETEQLRAELARKTEASRHSIERTSPKGPWQKFVGTCVLCGQSGLTFANMGDECPNQRGLTADEAVVEAIQRGDPSAEARCRELEAKLEDVRAELERKTFALKTVLGDAEHGQGMTWVERCQIGRAALAPPDSTKP